MRTRLLTVPLVLLLAPPALAADAGPVPSDPAEWAAFQDTLDRYTERMREFQGDVRSILDAYEADERSKISSSYGNAIQRSEDEEASLRRLAVSKIEGFLAKYPDTANTPDMMFRLADLYFEDSEIAFQGQMKDYERLEAQLDQNPSMALPEPPLKDYSRAMSLYERIIAKYPKYENLADTYYMLAWCYSAPNAGQFDPDKARDVYLAIVQRFPGSVFSNDANMRLGEYYFELPGPRDNPTVNIPVAIKYYEAVLADGPSGRMYDEAIYKLGWSHYKLNEYDKALAYLVKLLDYSDQQLRETGKISNMRPEAVEYLAISYADLADRTGKTPVEVATNHLKKVGDRKWQHDVVERLAQILLIQAKFDASIDTYRFLQQQWPLDPSNPVYQAEIARIYMTLPQGADLEKAGMAKSELALKYAEGTDWYNANRGNPDAIAKARGFIESSLAEVATERLLLAQKTNDPKDYAVAAATYKDFLAKFPFADDYDVSEWYMAYALYGSRQYREAEKAYLQILRNDRSPYRDGARVQLMRTRQEILLEKFGSRSALPQGAIVEGVDTTAFGAQVTRYMLSDEHKAFIQSCDDLATRVLTDKDYAAELEQLRPAMYYLPAEILYTHGHIEEARPRLEKMIAMFPDRDESRSAASMIINADTAQGDLKRLAEDAIRLGHLGTFTDQREQAMFNIAANLVKEGKYLEGAKAYGDFIAEFPKSQYRDEALYNQGNSMDKGGKAEEANRLFEQYIREYPADERAKGLYFRIADNYSATLQLERAIQYYEQLARNFPNFEDAPNAIFNAAFLRVGIGDHAGAAKAFERYATLNPPPADAEIVFWQAGEQWALVSEGEALDFYNRYLTTAKRMGWGDGNHQVEAWYKIAKIYQRRNDSRRAAQAWTNVQQAYTEYAGAGLTPRTRSLAAEGALDRLIAEYEAFKLIKWTNNEAKNTELLTKTKGAELRTITQDAVALIQTYQDFETAAAALYIQGMAFFAIADMAYDFPIPKGWSEDEVDEYRRILDEKFRIPFEDEGRKRLNASLEKAKSEKRWCEWNTKAQVALNERFPSDFPAERKESRGSTASSTSSPFAGPATIDEQNKGGGQ